MSYIVLHNNNEIFVFGSNEAGIHGAGAALTAKLMYGAKQGIGVGLHGRTYAIPTKDKNIRTLPLEKIKVYVDDFLLFANENSQYRFMLTPIGCGLAGYKTHMIAPMFANAPPCVIQPPEFIEWKRGA